MRRIAIIGAGELGAALGKVLAGRAEVALWDVDAAKVPGMKPLQEVVAGAGVVLCAVPSFAMRSAVTGCLPFLNTSETVLISLAKGIEDASRKTMDQVLAEIMPAGSLWGVMGGPMLAVELVAGKSCAAVVASSNHNVCTAVQEAFQGTNLAVEVSDDAHGVALAGVLKNIYAVVMGIAVGLGWGEDETGWLAARALYEMVAVGVKLGGREATLRGTAGFADFLATAYGETSRNRQAGLALAAGTPATASEGLHSLQSVLELLGPEATSFPILNALAQAALRGEPAKDAFGRLFGATSV
jgi:glycerol-3-phosphate dehydrogenase (NAD(P)+)